MDNKKCEMCHVGMMMKEGDMMKCNSCGAMTKMEGMKCEGKKCEGGKCEGKKCEGGKCEGKA